MMMKLTGINQITLRVNDLRQAESFYCNILGIPLDHRVGANIVYLRLYSDILVLVKAETKASPEARDIRVDHFGFRLPSDAEVDAAAHYLTEQGVHLVTRPANRREGRAFFVMDPDGNLIEFYSMHDKGITRSDVDIDISSPQESASVQEQPSTEEQLPDIPKKNRRSRK